MKKGVLILPLFLLCLFASSAFANISIVDDSHQRIFLNQPATRIISLAPNISEILLYIDAGKYIVGQSSSNDVLPMLAKVPIVATNNFINTELVYGLKPQIVIAWMGGNSMMQLDEIKRLGIPIYFAKFDSINNIIKTMHNLAVLTGTEAQSRIQIQNFQKQFDALKKQYESKKKIPVYYEVWHEPLFTISDKSIISEIIGSCGGENVFAHAMGIAPQITIESVIAAKPQVILTSSTNAKNISYWQKWPEIPAVKNKRIYSIPADEIERPGPRIIMGAQRMCEAINK